MKCLHFGEHREFGRVPKRLDFTIREHAMGDIRGVGTVFVFWTFAFKVSNTF